MSLNEFLLSLSRFRTNETYALTLKTNLLACYDPMGVRESLVWCLIELIVERDREKGERERELHVYQPKPCVRID